MSYIPEPITRIDKYLAYIAGNMDVALPDHPITRKEHYLAAWAEKSGFEDADVAGEPPLTLENGIGKPLKGLTLYGKSKQVATTGAQLISAKTDATEINGITYSSEYGKVVLNGTANADTTISIPSAVKLEEGKTYTISITSLIGVSNVAIYSSIITLDSTAKTAIATGTGTPGVLIYIASGTTYSNDELYVMVEEGSTAHPWEPYTGGQPSPSPDYPQKIESAGMKWSTGANLLDISQWNTYEKTYGLTCTIENDTVTIKGVYERPNYEIGTRIQAMYRFLRYKPGTTFPDGAKVAAQIIKGDGAEGIYVGSGLKENTPCIVIAFYAVVGDEVEIQLKPMIYIGDTVPEWEPYTGGVPKPYGDKIRVNVHGKNLIPFPYPLLGGAGTKTELNGVTYTVQEDGGVRCIGTPNSVFGVSLSMIRFSDKPLSVGGPTDGKVVLSGGPLYFDSNNKKLFFFFDTKQVGNPIDTVIYPQIELGTVATSYEPYHAPQSMSIFTQNGLPGIPVSSGGNYTDADGQQYVCDEVDLARGMYVQRVAYTTVDGDKIIFKETGNYWNLPRYSSPGCIYAYNHKTDFFPSNVFRSNNNHSFIFTTPEWMKEYFDTVDELNEFCKRKYDAGTPLTLYYALTTPVETPLTSDQLATYKALHTYKGTTIIDNDAGAYMSVRYEKMK